MQHAKFGPDALKTVAGVGEQRTDSASYIRCNESSCFYSAAAVHHHTFIGIV